MKPRAVIPAPAGARARGLAEARPTSSGEQSWRIRPAPTFPPAAASWPVICPSCRPGAVVPLGLTFDDVLLQPGESDVVPSRVDARTRLTRTVELNIPLLSSAIDTVAEARMAIAASPARAASACSTATSPWRTALQVDPGQRSESGMITNPGPTNPDDTLRDVDALCGRYRISGVPLVDGQGQLVGIVSAGRGAMRFISDPHPVHRGHEPGPRWSPPRSGERGRGALAARQRQVEKLPIVDDSASFAG